MGNIIAVVGIHDSIDRLPNDLAEVAEKAKNYEMARKMVSTLSSSKGGKVIGLIEGNEIVELPMDGAEVLKEIHRRLKSELGLEAEIGVGEDSAEALKALKYAKEHAPGSIKVYRPEFEHEESSKISDGLSEDIKQAINKSEKYQPIEEDERKQIAQIIMMLQDNKEMFDQMKDQAPEIYQGIVSLVQSITGILQYDKVAREQYLAEMVKKINDQVQKEKQKTMKGHAKKIDGQVKKESKKIDKEKEDRLSDLQDVHHKMHVSRRRDAQRFAEENGHDDPQFLMRLLSAFRK